MSDFAFGELTVRFRPSTHGETAADGVYHPTAGETAWDGAGGVAPTDKREVYLSDEDREALEHERIAQLAIDDPSAYEQLMIDAQSQDTPLHVESRN